MSNPIVSSRASARLMSRVDALREDGAVILRGAASAACVDGLRVEVERLFRDGEPRLLASIPPDATNEPLRPDHRLVRGIRLLDPHWAIHAARDALFSAPIGEVLAAYYGAAPRLFQSQVFVRSPETVAHRDDAYLALQPNRSLCAAWIALEAVGDAQGALAFVPGSHRIPRPLFGGMREHFTPPLDDAASHRRYIEVLEREVRRRALEWRYFDAEPGDAIVWDGCLLHASRPVRDPDATRLSLVGHYCAHDVEPRYLAEQRKHCIPRAEGDGDYCSGYYPSP